MENKANPSPPPRPYSSKRNSEDRQKSSEPFHENHKSLYKSKDTIANTAANQNRRPGRHLSDTLVAHNNSNEEMMNPSSIERVVNPTKMEGTAGSGGILRPPSGPPGNHSRVPSTSNSLFSSLGNSIGPSTIASYEQKKKKSKSRAHKRAVSYSSMTSQSPSMKSTTRYDSDGVPQTLSFNKSDSYPAPPTSDTSKSMSRHKQHRRINSSSQDSSVSWDASTFDTYSRASTRRTLDSRRTIESRGGSTAGRRSVSFHPSVTIVNERDVDDIVNGVNVRIPGDPAPTFWIWLAIVLSSILWFLAYQGKVRGELHYQLYEEQTWQLPTPRLLANKYFVESLSNDDTKGVEIYQMRWGCPPITSIDLSIQRNSTITLHKDGSSSNKVSFQYDYFRLNAGSTLELQATQLQGSSAIYLVRGVNVLSYLLQNGQYPFEYDNIRSLYLDATASSQTSNTIVSTSVPIHHTDAFILFYAASSETGNTNNINNDVSVLDVRVTLRIANHLLPDEAIPICSTQDTASGNCHWFTKQQMARLKVSCIIAKVVSSPAFDKGTGNNNDTVKVISDNSPPKEEADDDDDSNKIDETLEIISRDKKMFVFQSTSLATRNRIIFIVVSGTTTILVAVFLCCRSLQRKQPSSDKPISGSRRIKITTTENLHGGGADGAEGTESTPLLVSRTNHR